MPPLDVVMIGPFPSDATRIEGGVQASLFGLGCELRKSPEVASLRVLSTPGRPVVGLRRDTVSGIDVTFLDAPHGFLASAIVRLPTILRAIAGAAAPMVHLHGTGIVQAAVLLACRWKKTPLVWTMHGITEKEMAEARRREGGPKAWARWALYTACERLQLKLSRHIVVDTPYVVDAVAAHAGVTPMAIPQGIFLEEMAAARNPDRSAPVIVALGVIHPRKGHHLAIAAFAQLAANHAAARLIIVGAPTEADYLDELHATVARLGLADRVEIRVGESRDRVLAVLARARVFALHSQEESQGIALCEAMAAGLPIVATRVGGIPDVLGASGAGFLVDYGDTAAMAADLARLLDDDGLHAEMSAAATARAGDFAWPAIASRILAVYREAVADVGRG